MLQLVKIRLLLLGIVQHCVALKVTAVVLAETMICSLRLHEAFLAPHPVDSVILEGY